MHHAFLQNQIQSIALAPYPIRGLTSHEAVGMDLSHMLGPQDDAAHVETRLDAVAAMGSRVKELATATAITIMTCRRI